MKAASYFRLFVIHELIIPKELRLKFFFDRKFNILATLYLL